jgi:hypothetical protein
MKKMVKVQVRKEVETEVEVEFPVYSRHDIDGDGWSNTIFMRRDEDGTVYSIKQADTELEIEIRKASLAGSSLDYIMGRGEYESSPAEFHEALSRARKFLARIPEPQSTARQG